MCPNPRPFLLAAAFSFLSASSTPSPALPSEGRLSTGRVTLLSRARHDDYAKATFSFEQATRNEHGRDGRWKDPELQFGSGGDFFDVHLVTDDRSVVVDLGERPLEDPGPLPTFPAWKAHVTTRAPAVAGHLYAVHTKDTDSDHASLFRVTELLPGERCTLEWVCWVPAPRVERPGLDLLPGIRDRLSVVLDDAIRLDRRAEEERVGRLGESPEVVLQVRTGAQGGNRSRLRLDGSTERLPDEMNPRELDFSQPPEKGSAPTWFAKVGLVPADRVLVVESVEICAAAPGDGNGLGEAAVSLPCGEIFRLQDQEGPVRLRLEGLALVRKGEEDRVAVELANSSAINARIHGRLVSPEEATRLEPLPFLTSPTSGGEPRAVLQIRAGAGGGNPNRLTLLGKATPYLDRISYEPLSFEKPVSMHERSVGYTSGLRIPPGKVFVLTSASWTGTAAGDSNGHGEFLLKVGGTVLAHVRDSKEPVQGAWSGRIEIRRGEEGRVFLEVANSSSGDVLLEGGFEGAR
ncbi:MAG: hypothetical protein L0323_20920 [Planctomycetes bacterium]|nr:hypothetical protein [Planctomycetota bacterium]